LTNSVAIAIHDILIKNKELKHCKKIMTTVLVVEDTISEQDLIVGYLVESGYSVITATNGQDAIAKITGKKLDVVVTDLVMP